MLTNLISNAFKFTPSGGTVRVCVTLEEQDGEHVVYHFQVIDNGVGISKENQERIFGAFEQWRYITKEIGADHYTDCITTPKVL